MSESNSNFSFKDLPGYELTQREVFDLSNGYVLQKVSQDTNTKADYQILLDEKSIGKISLNLGLKRNEAYFDISINDQGHRHRIKSLQALAQELEHSGFILMTGGIMPESRAYWEKLYKEGLVEPIDKNNLSETNYRVVVQ